MLQSIWNRICGLRCIYVFLFSVTYWKSLKHKISHWPTKYLREKNFGPNEIFTWKKLDPRNINEKNFWISETPTRKRFGLTKFPWEKKLNQRNSQDKMIWIHEIKTRKNSGPAKYSRRHDRTGSTRLKMTWGSRNLANSTKADFKFWIENSVIIFFSPVC